MPGAIWLRCNDQHLNEQQCSRCHVYDDLDVIIQVA